MAVERFVVLIHHRSSDLSKPKSRTTLLCFTLFMFGPPVGKMDLIWTLETFSSHNFIENER